MQWFVIFTSRHGLMFWAQAFAPSSVITHGDHRPKCHTDAGRGRMVKKGLPHVACLDVSRELVLEMLTRFPSCLGHVWANGINCSPGDSSLAAVPSPCHYMLELTWSKPLHVALPGKRAGLCLQRGRESNSAATRSLPQGGHAWRDSLLMYRFWIKTALSQEHPGSLCLEFALPWIKFYISRPQREVSGYPKDNTAAFDRGRGAFDSSSQSLLCGAGSHPPG